MDSDDAVKAVWRAELLARLELLEQLIERDRVVSASERRSKLLETTRRHYLRLLDQLSVDGKVPMWRDLNP
jgi:hypothetical protein